MGFKGVPEGLMGISRVSHWVSKVMGFQRQEVLGKLEGRGSHGQLKEFHEVFRGLQGLKGFQGRFCISQEGSVGPQGHLKWSQYRFKSFRQGYK